MFLIWLSSGKEYLRQKNIRGQNETRQILEIFIVISIQIIVILRKNKF